MPLENSEILETGNTFLREKMLENAKKIEDLEEQIDFEKNNELGALKLKLDNQEIEEGLSGEEEAKRISGIVDLQIEYINAINRNIESHHNPPNIENK